MSIAACENIVAAVTGDGIIEAAADDIVSADGSAYRLVDGIDRQTRGIGLAVGIGQRIVDQYRVLVGL